MLLDPSIKRRDILQLAPKVRLCLQSQAQPMFPVPICFPCRRPHRKSFRVCNLGRIFQPAAPEPLTLSPSGVGGYRSCPQQFLFRHLWSLRQGPRATLTFGAVMHKPCAALWISSAKGYDFRGMTWRGLYESRMEIRRLRGRLSEEGYKNDGLDQLRAFHQSIVENPPHVLELEKGFELPLEK